MYIIYAILSAIAAGIATLFSKISIKNDSTLISGIRTIIIFIITLIFFIINFDININLKALLFITISGIFTTLLWIFNFKALSISNISNVSALDRSSIIFTIIISSIILNEKITINKIISIILIIIGILLMIKDKHIFYPLLSALCNSLITIFAKLGINKVNPYTATFIRTFIVLILIWIIIITKGKDKEIKEINKKNYIYIILSGIATSLSWIFYFNSLKGNINVVFAIEKLNIVVSVILSCIILKEHLSIKNILGLILLVLSTIILIL